MDLMKHRGEILRALANKKFEVNDDGAVVLGAGINAIPMGVFDAEHRRYEPTRARATLRRMSRVPLVGPHVKRLRLKRGGGDLLARVIGSNIIPLEGLTHMLSVVVAGGGQVNPWYVALFEGNVTPGSGYTAATFPATATECTAYDEATRQVYNESPPSAGAVDNAANRAVFTMNATKTVYGGALLSVSTKSSTSGVLLAAARFSSSRAVIDDDELAVRYTLTLTST